MTDAKLEKLLFKWQMRLKLMDWQITATLGTFPDSSTCMGEAEIRTRWKEADITVKNVENVELNLVHELLHVKFPYLSNEFSGYPTDSQLFKEEIEQGVESLAKCFMEAYDH